jgi:hypothetical protein
MGRGNQHQERGAREQDVNRGKAPFSHLNNQLRRIPPQDVNTKEKRGSERQCDRKAEQ